MNCTVWISRLKDTTELNDSESSPAVDLKMAIPKPLLL